MRKAITALCFFTAAAAFAAPLSDTYLLPVAGHVSGLGGQTWMTDVTLHNVTDEDLVVEIGGLRSNGDPMDLTSDTVTIGPRGTLALRDLVQPSALGALLIAADAPFAVAGKIYSEAGGGFVGQAIGAANDLIDASHPDAYLTGLVANDHQRTNLGFFGVAEGTPLRVEITLLSASGASLGSRTFDVPAGQVSHVLINTRDIAAAAFDAATARVRVLEGDGVAAPYASVVDNATRDAIFVPVATAAAESGNLQRQASVLRRRMLKNK
jgi:hypothetical protein